MPSFLVDFQIDATPEHEGSQRVIMRQQHQRLYKFREGPAVIACLQECLKTKTTHLILPYPESDF